MFQSSGKFRPVRARFGPRGALNAPGMPRRGRTGKPGGGDRFINQMNEPEEG